MASSRKPASDPAAQGDEALRARRAAADSQMFVSPGADSTVNDRASPEPEDASPAVGKTSGRGAKAERPSPVSERRQAAKPPVESSRSVKPPAETPKAGSGRARPKAAAS
jgi:hypothetical protein